MVDRARARTGEQREKSVEEASRAYQVVWPSLRLGAAACRVSAPRSRWVRLSSMWRICVCVHEGITASSRGRGRGWWGPTGTGVPDTPETGLHACTSMYT